MMISGEVSGQPYYGPERTPPKGATITFTGTESDGQIGRAGGKDYTITNVGLAGTTTVYWGMLADSIKLSMDGQDYAANEVLQYSTASDPAAGKLIWKGTTVIRLDPAAGEGDHKDLLSRFVITVTDNNGDPLSLTPAQSVGLPDNMGALVAVTDVSMLFKVKMEMFVSEDNGSTWVPHLDYYDAQPTYSEVKEAWSTYDYGFYWVNDPPELENNQGIHVDEGDTAVIAPSLLKGIDAESGDTALWFIFDPDSLGTLPAHGIVLLDGNTLKPRDSVSQASINDSLLLYIHDGSETLRDSIPLILKDSDGAVWHDGDDTLFYVQITINPVNDPPVVTLNKEVSVDEGDTVFVADTVLLTTDAESDAEHITYTLDPDGNSDYPQHGLLMLGTVPLSDGGTFTQEDIDNGNLYYVHDGSESTHDGFIFNVRDENGHYASENGSSIFFFRITVNPVNDPPVLVNNQPVTVAEGDTGFITNLYLAASDPDNPPDQIFFTLDPEQEVMGPLHGVIMLNDTPLGDGDVFTQDDLNNSRVTYVHDGSEDPHDFFVVTVTDADGGIASDNGFTHFQVTLNITQVNDPPYLINPVPDQTAIIGYLFSYTIPDTTFLNVDPGDSLIYEISLADGNDLPGWLSYDNRTLHMEGTPAEEDADTLEVVITALDTSMTAARDTFTIIVRISPVSVGTLDKGALSIRPNPFHDHLILTLSDELKGEIHIRMIDLTGRVRYETTFYKETGSAGKTIHTGTLPNGIYLLYIRSAEKHIVRKVIRK
jgi:hypothetical protein